MSGRWIVNDKLRLAERTRHFNLPQLLLFAAQSVNRSPQDIEYLEKLAESGFNRVFLITMHDGFRMIVRVPYPSVTPNLYLAVASEVATMVYLRSMGIPVPEVYGYSARKDNEAGTEFIFIEFVEGKNVAEVLMDELGEKNVIWILKQVVDLEKRMTEITFPAGGSLYFAEDLENVPGCVSGPIKGIPLEDKQFCVGPQTSYPLWFGRRSQLDVDRGPYTTPEEAITRGAEKELAYLQKFGRPLLPWHRMRMEDYKYEPQQPSDHIQNLKKYLLIAPSLLAKASSSSSFCIRHPDLQPSNILVSRSPDSNSKAWVVNSIIDWQHTAILPLSLHAGIPQTLQNYNDDGWKDMTQPSLPEGWNEMEEAQREREMEVFRRRTLHYHYVRLTERHHVRHAEALADPMCILRRRLFHEARDPWEGDTVGLKIALVNATTPENSEQLTGGGVPCPVAFDADEVRETVDLDKKLGEADEMMEKLRDLIGVGLDGWVSTENYGEVMKRVQILKERVFEVAENEAQQKEIAEHWPFDDFDEEEYR